MVDNKTLALMGQSLEEYSSVRGMLIHRMRLQLVHIAEENQLALTEINYHHDKPLDPSIEEFIQKFRFKCVFHELENSTLINVYTNSSHSVLTTWQGSDCSVELVSYVKAELEMMLAIRKNKPLTSAGTVYMVASKKNGLSVTPIGKAGVPLVRDNYTSDIISSFDYITQSFSEPDPAGRLVILHGEPGTGKSFFIRGLLESVKNVKCVLMPAQLAVRLEDPQFLTTMLEEVNDDDTKVPILIIIEDADAILTNRADGDMSAISALLNMADGIFGSLIDLRIIATTNAKSVDIDVALLRPGRLLEKVHIGLLSSEQAEAIYYRLTEQTKKYSRPITLTEVYADAGNYRNRRTKEDKKSIGF